MTAQHDKSGKTVVPSLRFVSSQGKVGFRRLTLPPSPFINCHILAGPQVKWCVAWLEYAAVKGVNEGRLYIYILVIIGAGSRCQSGLIAIGHSIEKISPRHLLRSSLAQLGPRFPFTKKIRQLLTCAPDEFARDKRTVGA